MIHKRFFCVKANIKRVILATFLEINEALKGLLVEKQGSQRAAFKNELLEKFNEYAIEANLVKDADKFMPINFTKTKSGLYFFPLIPSSDIVLKYAKVEHDWPYWKTKIEQQLFIDGLSPVETFIDQYQSKNIYA